MKKQNGITLMALIITIIIMLILAFIAISSVNDSKIISETEDASSRLNELQKYEDKLRNELIDELKPDYYTPPSTDDNDDGSSVGSDIDQTQGKDEDTGCLHINSVEIPAKEATCTEDGNEKGWQCSDCNHREVISIPAGHIEGDSEYYLPYNDTYHTKIVCCGRGNECNEYPIEVNEKKYSGTYEQYNYLKHSYVIDSYYSEPANSNTCEECNHTCNHNGGDAIIGGKCSICGFSAIEHIAGQQIIINIYRLDEEWANNYVAEHGTELFDSGHPQVYICTLHEDCYIYEKDNPFFLGDAHGYVNGVCSMCEHVCSHNDSSIDSDPDICYYCGWRYEPEEIIPGDGDDSDDNYYGNGTWCSNCLSYVDASTHWYTCSCGIDTSACATDHNCNKEYGTCPDCGKNIFECECRDKYY